MQSAPGQSFAGTERELSESGRIVPPGQSETFYWAQTDAGGLLGQTVIFLDN